MTLLRGLTLIALATLAGVGFLTLMSCMQYKPTLPMMLLAILIMSNSLNKFSMTLTAD